MLKVSGAILAGGKSKRFGRNKALELFNGERLVDINIKLLEKFCGHLFIIANDLRSYVNCKATLVKDIIPSYGPLGGIYTALLFSMHDWVFVRAVDMPFLSYDLVDIMLQEAEKGCDVVIPYSEQGYEPLCALYNRKCIPFIVRSIKRGDKRVISFFSRVKVRQIGRNVWQNMDPDGLSFANVNTQEDFLRLSGGLSRSS